MKNKSLKKILFIIFAIINANVLFAQNIPQNFNYQAVARNNEGQPIALQPIILEISILKGNDCANSSCNLIYQEIHTPTTNSFGLFSIEIGKGQSTYNGSVASFNNIDWYNVLTNNEYYLKVRVDFGDASVINGLVVMGVTKFQSVPYSIISSETEFSHLSDSANFSKMSADVKRVNSKLPFNLTEMADVNISTLSNSQVLQYNGTKWVNANVAGGSSSLATLTDVSLTSPAANQFLSFDGTSKWTNSNLYLNNISGFNVSATPTLNDVIAWDGTNWTNKVNSASGVWQEDANNVFYYGNKNIGIGTNSPLDGFHAVLGAGKGVLFSGTYSGGLIQDLNAGTRMYFYPTNASFRAGGVDGAQWNSANVGNYSAAFGLNNIASGTASFASGTANQAKAPNSVSFGGSNVVEGNYATALGFENQLFGNYSIYGFATGHQNNVLSTASSALGEGLQAKAYAMTVLGHYNLTFGDNIPAWTDGQPIFVIGNGTGTGALRSDAMVVYNNGNAWLSKDFSVKTISYHAKSENNKSFIKIENPLEIIKQIQGLKWNENDINTSSTINYGFDTKSVEAVLPDLVHDNNGSKSIDYVSMIPVLLEAIKEQQKRIEELEKEVNELKK